MLKLYQNEFMIKNYTRKIFLSGLSRWMVGCLLFLLLHQAVAQTRAVTGTVTSSVSERLPGVTVLIKGTNNGTISSADGSYSLANVNESDILVFSFTGMKTVELAVGNQTIIDVVLEDDITQLKDVIVVGYGTQEAEDVTGAVSMIKSKDLELRPNTQLGSMLYGRAAGVVVNPGSGKPGEGISISIRGLSSVGGSDPLYVIDGVPTANTRFLNPADVESVTVLKDASSAAIYGAQGATGVVLITTKSGTSSTPVVDFNMYGGFTEISKRYDLLNASQYQELMSDLGFNTDWSRFSENTDWQDKVFQNGRMQNYQLSVSGKSNNTNYYISGSWLEEMGAIRSNEMQRTNFKLNLDQRVNKWLKLGTRISYSNFNNVDVDDREVLRSVLITPPVIGIYNPDGSFTSNPFQDWENPFSITDGLYRNYVNRSFLGNAFAEVTFLEHFTFKTSIGVEQTNGLNESFRDPFRTSFGRAIKGSASAGADQYNYRIFDNTLSYKRSFNKHSVEALVGTIGQYYKWEEQWASSVGFSSDKIKTVAGGSTLTGGGSTAREKKNISYISRVNYAFDDKYLVTVNFRRDGSSVFGPDQRYGNFYAGSLGWRISEEAFLKNINWVNDVKLRVGWGVNGNDPIAPYSYLGVANTGTNYITFEGQVLDPKTNLLVDSVRFSQGISPGRIENRNLKWEETTQFNIGLDLSVLSGRISASFDVYDKRSNDVIISNIPVPRTSGFNTTTGNAASLQNRGLEVLVNTVNIDREIKWTTNLNVTVNRNKVLDFRGTENIGGAVDGAESETTSITRENSPFALFYGYVFAGVDPDNGRAQYRDSDNELTYAPTPDDRRVIGNPHPDFIYGLTNTISYKGIGLSIFLQGSQGNDIVNATRFAYIEDMSSPANQSTEVLRRWQSPGDVTNIPRVFQPGSNQTRFNHIFSSRFVEDGSYLRVKALTLSYDFPSRLLIKARIQSLKVYATGENLLTFTKYSGLDPEVNRYGGNSFSRGLDNAVYPQLRKIIFGVNLTL
jgi:TonB-dependent starch-binding outer membrane protein SusC